MFRTFLNSSIKTKLIIVNTLVLLISGIFIFFFVSAREEQRALVSKRSKAESMANMLAYTISMNLEQYYLGLIEVKDLELEAKSIETDTEFYAVDVLDLDGTLLLSIKKGDAVLRNFELTVPIVSGSNEIIGKVILKLHLEEVYNELQKGKLVVISVIIGSVIVGFLSIYLIAHWLIRPLKNLEEVTDTFSLGKLNSRVPIAYQDEIGRLGLTFNRMADKLEDYTKNLEIMVEEKTAELHEAQEKLFTLARDMGMAELSMSVLHNIGNAITPLIVKLTTLLEQIRRSDFLLLNQFSNLIDLQTKHKEAHGDLVKFYTEDPKGKKIPQFLELFVVFLHKQKDLLETDIAKLYKFSQHIEDIIRLQMNYAKITDEIHSIEISGFMDDAIAMQQSSLDKRKVKVFRNYQPGLIIFANKTKFMQVLQNIIKNAYESIELATITERKITVSTQYMGGDGDTMVRIAIVDDGIGIEEKQLESMFQYGYTTKKRGTGLGLHSSENFINAVKGQISCYSDGLGKGARFEIDIPGKITA